MGFLMACFEAHCTKELTHYYERNEMKHRCDATIGLSCSISYILGLEYMEITF